MKAFRYARGTRVEVKKASFPMGPDLVGRTGLVVEIDNYRIGRYGVQLDGESALRDLHEDELEPLSEDPKPESDQGSPGPGLR